MWSDVDFRTGVANVHGGGNEGSNSVCVKNIFVVFITTYLSHKYVCTCWGLVAEDWLSWLIIVPCGDCGIFVVGNANVCYE